MRTSQQKEASSPRTYFNKQKTHLLVLRLQIEMQRQV